MNRETKCENNLTTEQIYKFKDMEFIVTPKFKNEGEKSLFTVLLELMKNDVESCKFL